MNISTIEINGEKRSCLSEPGFGNVDKYVFITVENGIFDESLGGTVNPYIKEMIDRAIRSGAKALQMEGNDMIGKTTYAIYSYNVNTTILNVLKQLAPYIVVDNINTVRMGYLDGVTVKYAKSWEDAINNPVVTGKELVKLEEESSRDMNVYSKEELSLLTVAKLDEIINSLEKEYQTDIVVKAPKNKADKIDAILLFQENNQ